MLKKAILFPALLFCLFHLNAQLRDNLKLGIEPGFLLLSASENLSVFLNVEPKLKIAKNTFMGLRIGIVLNHQHLENHMPLQFELPDEFDNGGISFVPTLDHYFYEKRIGEKFFRPYLGLGAGVYLLSRYVDVISFNPRDQFEVEVDRQVGALFRAGLESAKIRLGLEYNLVQKADIQLPNGQVIGNVGNSYLGLFFGFILGPNMG